MRDVRPRCPTQMYLKPPAGAETRRRVTAPRVRDPTLPRKERTCGSVSSFVVLGVKPASQPFGASRPSTFRVEEKRILGSKLPFYFDGRDARLRPPSLLTFGWGWPSTPLQCFLSSFLVPCSTVAVSDIIAVVVAGP